MMLFPEKWSSPHMSVVQGDGHWDYYLATNQEALYAHESMLFTKISNSYLHRHKFMQMSYTARYNNNIF